MSLEVLAAAALSVCFGLGLVAVVTLVRGGTLLPERSRRRRKPGDGRRVRQLLIAGAAGVVVLLATRWPVAAAGAAVLVLVWPRVFGGGAAGRRQLTKIEALASWTESLRDTSMAANGLEQAIPATAPYAPPILQPPLRALTAQLEGRVPLPEALARFGDDLDDATADMVVATLILNSRQRKGGLVRILGSLAESARAELEMRRKVETERRGLRRQSRTIVIAVVVFAVMQAVFAHSYVEPYATGRGQVVLAVVIAIFVAAFMRMRSLSEAAPAPRFLTGADEVTEIASYRPAVAR